MVNGSEEDRDMAAWNWWVQENHVCGDVEHNFNQIDPKSLPEARSVSFWEAHIFYELLWGEKALDLLDVDKLPKVPISIVQGKGDDVCPPIYAQNLEKKLIAHGFKVESFYVDSGHRCLTGNPIQNAVTNCAVKFAQDRT